MLSRLELVNYRGFAEHSVQLKPLTVLVGKNNAGKSTLVEALRLISIVTERLGGLNFRDPPMWSELPKRSRGLQPSLEGLGINFDAISHRYADAPAVVKAHFEAGERIEFFASKDGAGHAVLYDSSGSLIRSKSRLRDLQFPRLRILPQVAPLEPEEKILSDEYVRRNMSSPLAPRHFRNQLRLLQGAYREFRSLAEDTWPGLQVKTLEGARGNPGDDLFLAVRDRDFVAEVARMGHGLQMWLQTMWFLSRTPREASVVLDEPDVYMHPDLQRRMIRLVRDRFNQVLVATHSVEIMAEVAPSEVLIIDRERPTSVYANSDPAVQGLVDRLGGIHNLQLARLWSAKRCLFFEGKDVRFLKLVHDLMYPGSALPLDEIPHSSIGGWGGWSYAIGSSIFIRNSVGEDITTYCVLDSDYHTRGEVRTRLKEAKKKNVHLHVWRRKEIENYFLIPAAISRAINVEATRGRLPVTPDRIRDKLEEVADALRVETQDSFAEQIQVENRSWGTKKVNQRARELMDDAFGAWESQLAAVSGKSVLGSLSGWSEQEFGVSIGVSSIIRAMARDELPSEVESVVEAIHTNAAFQTKAWKREWVSS